ncbi:hypothetical protein CyaNS01_01104 [Cyanobium sp. NS01]|nr:hypothetical protein CyaNS01_01104 [Cyanobium sp. NS01]
MDGAAAQACSSFLTMKAINPSEAARAISRARVMEQHATEGNYRRVFVYGTLQRGLVNHGWLAKSPFLGNDSLPGAWLHDLGPFPMAVPDPSGDAGALVHGELFAITEVTLVQLDRLEGAPRLYQRHWLPLLSGASAWVYLGRAPQVRHSPRLLDGRWRGRRR